MDTQMKIPQHVAFIMDGNGRWAKKRFLPRTLGHKAGTENLRKIITYAKDIGISYVTFYAFSTENWKRPAEEISALMDILLTYLRAETKNFVKEGARLNILGDLSDFAEEFQNEINNSVQLTKNCDRIIVNIALNYSGRSDIIHGINEMLKNGTVESITENDFSKYLYTKDMPEPDLLIRTSGELRISNFFLWQLAYSELYFTDVLWPDFNEKEFEKALKNFTQRDRRFGGLKDD
ncbi:MAG: isoprenyl transferase [Clostridiales bacterium]|nr:isoprenyl transferase [Clostridiales bacterium]